MSARFAGQFLGRGLALAWLAAMGCRSSAPQPPLSPAPTAQPEPMPDLESMGPVRGLPPVAGEAVDDGRADESQAGDAGTAEREDGRPPWWFDIPRYEGGRVSLCAEALAAGGDEATKAAVELGRARLRAALRMEAGGTIPGEQVERSFAWPLPARGGVATHSGYVLISAPVR